MRKTFFVNGSWRELTKLFTIPVHQKTGKTNSRWMTFTTQTANMHDAYLKIAPDMVENFENGKIDMSKDVVLVTSQIKISEKTGKTVLKILVSPFPQNNPHPSHRLVVKELSGNEIGINAEPLGDFINGRAQKYAHVAKITTGQPHPAFEELKNI